MLTILLLLCCNIHRTYFPKLVGVCANNLSTFHLCLNRQGYMDLPPSELNALVKKQEDILAAAQKDFRRASCCQLFSFVTFLAKTSISHS